jgi:hypothetical protein
MIAQNGLSWKLRIGNRQTVEGGYGHAGNTCTPSLHPELDQMDPQPIPATVVPEPVYCEDVFLDLAKADSGKVHDQVVLAIELQRKRSVCRHLSESILLIDVVDDCFGRFVIGSPARSTNWPLTVSDSPSWTMSGLGRV